MESTPRRCMLDSTAPRKFFGSPVFANVQTRDDVIKALKTFCKTATIDDIINARRELCQLAARDREVYNEIAKLIWSLDFPGDSVAFDNQCQLITADWF